MASSRRRGRDGRSPGRFLGQELLGEDVLRDEDDGRPEGAQEPKGVGAEVEGACEHDSQGEGCEGEVGRRAVANAEEEGVGGDGEERGEGLRIVNSAYPGSTKRTNAP